MPPQPELDEQFSAMIDMQGYKDAVRQNMMLLADAHKWQLLQSYQQEQERAAGDIREQPEHWISVLNIEPTIDNLENLAKALIFNRDSREF